MMWRTNNARSTLEPCMRAEFGMEHPWPAAALPSAEDPSNLPSSPIMCSIVDPKVH
jgi:hypothetical protein